MALTYEGQFEWFNGREARWPLHYGGFYVKSSWPKDLSTEYLRNPDAEYSEPMTASDLLYHEAVPTWRGLKRDEDGGEGSVLPAGPGTMGFRSPQGDIPLNGTSLDPYYLYDPRTRSFERPWHPPVDSTYVAGVFSFRYYVYTWKATTNLYDPSPEYPLALVDFGSSITVNRALLVTGPPLDAFVQAV